MKMMGIIFASDNEARLNELTIHRTTASLPFGARYRMIDFMLSNLVNSGVTRIGIITRSNYNSLMDHIRMGRDWDLNRKNSGIAVFPPFAVNTSKEVYRGKIEALYSILDYIRTGNEDYVFVCNSNVAINMDIEDMYDFHIATGADITVLTRKQATNSSKRIVVGAKEGTRIKEFLINEGFGNGKTETVSLNAYILHKDVLCGLIETAYARGQMEFETDILQKKTKQLNIQMYNFNGYAGMINDIKSYFNESMRLLDTGIRQELFYKYGKIYTKVKDSSPTIYSNDAKVVNSLIADGCEVNGTVENSILFRGVKVEKGAVIKNSIVMERGQVQENSQLCYAITDKNVIIRPNRVISGFETYPVVVVKDKTV